MPQSGGRRWMSKRVERPRLKRSLLPRIQGAEIIPARIDRVLAVEVRSTRACRTEIGDGIKPVSVHLGRNQTPTDRGGRKNNEAISTNQTHVRPLHGRTEDADQLCQIGHWAEIIEK